MGAGAGKKAKKADRDEEGPPTVTEPSAPPPQPAMNPEFTTHQQPQAPYLYPQLPPQPPFYPQPQQPPQPMPASPGAPPPPTQPMQPPQYDATYSVPHHQPETTFTPPEEPTIHAVSTGTPGPNEYLLEIPSIEVVRTGQKPVNTDTLKKYFSSNKKSHGGKIASITEDDDCYVINFEDIDVAQEVLSYNHVLEGTQLQVRHRKRPTVEVLTGRDIDEDRLRMYFKNTHRSGGGPIDSITEDPKGVFYITFTNKRAVDGVIKKSPHSIDGHDIVVLEKLSLIDHKCLLIKGIPPDATSGLLNDYLEGLDNAQGKLHIARIYRGEDNSMAVVSLLHEIDGKTRNEIAKEIKRVPIRGKTVSVSPIVVTRSVQLSGLTKGLTRELLVNYFENTDKSGGGKVLDISIDEQTGTAIIRFKDPTVVPRVVSRPIHEFEAGRISVCTHYDTLGIITEIVPTSSAPSADHANVPLLIKRKNVNITKVDKPKLCLLEKQRPRLTLEFPNVEFDINPDQCKVTIAGIEDEAKQARDNIKSKLDDFRECTVPLSYELQSILSSRNDTMKTFETSLAEKNVQNAVHFTVENNNVVIWGVDQSTVNTAESCVRATFKEISSNVPIEIMKLIDWDDLVVESNKGANYNAVMSCDKNSGQVKIAGLIREVEDIERKLDGFLAQHHFETSFVNAEKLIVKVLVKRQKDQLNQIKTDNQVAIDETTTGFKVRGPRDRMKKVSDAVKSLVANVMKTTEQYKKPGLGKLFGEDTFQKLLKGVEENQGCALEWDCKTRTPLPREKTTLKGLRPTRPSISSSSIGPISVDIEQGNIESESTDVIVNPVTSSKAFTVVGDSLVESGGQSIKTDFERNWGRRLSSVLLADAGTLQCKTVAHMELLPGDKLKDAVCQCLVLSSQSGMRSIAFPAIGTGRGGMKSFQSAKVIRDGIEQFVRQNPSPVLTHVKLTIFVQQMVADYKAEFHKPLGKLDPPGRITTPSPGQHEMSFGSVRMQVQQGDISRETTDVVVSPILEDMEFTVITKTLVNAGGHSIADEIKTTWPKRTDKVVLTTAGTLPSKKVAHVVLPDASDLKDSVVSCLMAADKLGMTSISFPAIGTGGMMSQAESAKGIYNGVQEFGSQLRRRNLKLVRVTIYDGNMLGTFHSTMQQYAGVHSAHASPGGPGQIGTVDVQIQQGDLTKETTDAIVNPVDTNGGFFAVGKALEQAGGSTLRTHCQTSWNQRRNDVLVTDGGNLPCKKVIHAVCPNARSMKERVLECLLQAEAKGLKSVSFPAIGTGGFGVSVADAASGTVQGIKEFALTRNPTSVRLVRVTVFQASMVSEFQQALKAAVPNTGAPAPPTVKMTPKIDVEQVVEVTFYACYKRDMDNAKREVSKTIDGYMTRERVNDATIRHLEQHEKDSIMQMGADHLVLVTITGQTIEMTGLKDVVATLLREIESFLLRKKNADELEELSKDIVKVPGYWAKPPPGVTGAYMHKLDEASQEYKDVKSNFLASVGYQPQIVSIFRVQNEAKYKTYLSELKERRKTCPKSKVEELLYHGTAGEDVKNINQGNFNRSYGGKNALAYGQGVYFAKNASYSAQDTYSPPDSQGNKYIYQARVIVGEYTAGGFGMVEPPAKGPSNSVIRYDSVVDRVENPSIFVVFGDTDAYPEFLIVFK